MRLFIVSLSLMLAFLLLSCGGGGAGLQIQTDKPEQTPQITLTVGSAVGKPDSVIQLPLTLSGATSQPPSALQWTIKSDKNVTITMVDGPAAVAASKTVVCNLITDTIFTTSNTTVCLLVGMNENVLANGVVAFLNVSLPSDLPASGTVVEIDGAIGSSVNATTIVISGVSGTVTHQ